MSLLELRNLYKNFGGITALEDVSFSVQSRSIVSIIGPNGAGKTTLFNCISGLIPLTSGRVIFKGKDISKLPAHRISGIARTFQNIRLFSSMSTLDNVLVGLDKKASFNIFDVVFSTKRSKALQRELQDRAMGFLAFVGLDKMANVPATALAYGHRRRLEIARALATEPDLLLLDEPTAGMNPQETEQMMTLIKEIQRLGTTILLIEHDMRLVMGISERVIVLDYGAKIADDVPERVKTDPAVIEAYLGVSQ